MKPRPRRRVLAARFFAGLAGLVCLSLCMLPARSEPELGPPVPPGLTLSAAVQLALQRNPALATFRRNRGIAEAVVQVARQYPFNPIIQHYMWGDWGPASAGITNHFFQEHTSRLDLEIYGQGKYRRGAAAAALTRTEWEIAAQELLTAVLVIRSYNTLLYRRGKNRVLEEGVELTEKVAEQTQKLFNEGAVKSADLLLAQADVSEARNSLGPARSVLVVAENDLRRNLGLIGDSLTLEGTLEKGYVLPPANILLQAALQRRPDVHALEFAVKEADNRLRFEIANRWGNPSLGPSGEVNETSVGFVGLWMIWQAPIINTRKGEIHQRQAERARAMQALQQGETLTQQDVIAAMNRLRQAETVVRGFVNDTFPKLRQTREEIDKLYLANQPGVDLARVIDVRRRLLRARDAYLDVLFEMSQAQTDLAAAVSDLSFAGCQTAPATTEGEQTPSAQQQPPRGGEELPPPVPLNKEGEQLPRPAPLPPEKR